MAFLAITPNGLIEALRLAASEKIPVWCGADAVTEEQFKIFHQEGANITRFIYPLGGRDPKIIAYAAAIINEHHPNEKIWVEYET